MRVVKSLLVMVVVVGLVAVKAFAGPIPVPLPDPKLLPEQVVKGQSTLLGDDNSAIQVDWMVVWFSGPDLYGYFYQLENFSSVDVSSFSLIPYGGPIINVFVAPNGTDWDETPTNWPPLSFPPAAGEHNITGEVEPTGGIGNNPIGGRYNYGAVTWTWNPDYQLKPQTETVIIGFFSPMKPVYGKGNAFDGGPTVGWGPRYNTNSDPLPVPSPEPGTLAMLLMGMGIFAIRRWRR